MPRSLALALSADTRASGTRMVMRAVLGRRSQSSGWNWVKSRSDRSWSRKASPSSSVVISGTKRFFISDHLSCVHVARADRAQPPLAPAESDEDGTALFGAAYGDEALFLAGMPRIGGHPRAMCQSKFDLRNAQPVFLTLGAVAIVPVECMYIRAHNQEMATARTSCA